MKIFLGTIFVIFYLFLSNSVFAHSGRTDGAGCHTCRTNCTSWGLESGEYHCHRAKTSAPQPLEPVTSHKVEDGVGVTTPAPEYKTPIADKTEVKKEEPAKVPLVIEKTSDSPSDEKKSSTGVVVGTGSIVVLAYAAFKALKK